jgi:ABC-type transporter Mla subunit MlaD
MRRVTRNAVIGLVVIVVLLLALGALPGFLGTGDPYYVTATADDDGVYVRDGERLYRLAVTRRDDD